MIDEQDAVRAELDALAAAAPPVGFTPGEVVRRGRRRRQARRGAGIAAGVVLLAAAVAVPAAVFPRHPAPGNVTALEPERTTAPATRTPEPTGTQNQSRPEPVVPGLSASEIRRLARACARASNETNEAVLSKARVYNIVRDAVGVEILVYAPGLAANCSGPDLQHVAMGDGQSGDQSGASEWLPGPMSIDIAGSSWPPAGTSGLGSRTVSGRVVAGITSVKIDFGDDHAQVAIRNGTYLYRVVKPNGWQPGDDDGPRVVGLDGAGHLVARGTYFPAGCWTAPDGTKVIRNPGTAGNCRPATPWR